MRILLINLCLIVTLVRAQSKQEFSVWLGGGSSTLLYNLNQGYYGGRLGFSTGTEYTLYLHPQWGIGIGVDYALYNSKTLVAQSEDDYLITNNAYPGNFYFLTNQSGYEEKQQAGYLKIPFRIRFQGINDDDKIYAAAGFSIGIPIHSRYKSTTTTLKTSGYSAYTGNIYEDIPDFGYSTYSNVTNTGTLDLKVSYMLNGELGLKLKCSKNKWCYVGFYFEYGLNDVRKNGTTHITQYQSNNPSEFVSNSITNSQYTVNRNTGQLVEKVSLLAVGVQTRFGIGK